MSQKNRIDMDRLKVKEWRNVYQQTLIKAGVAILISHKLDPRTRNITTDTRDIT